MKGQKIIVWVSLCIVFLPAIFYLLLSRGKNEYTHLPVYGNFGTAFLQASGLKDQKNVLLGGKAFEGKYLVTSFYTVNDDTLNNTLDGHLRKIQNLFSNAGDVRIVSFVLSSGSGYASLGPVVEKEGALYGTWYFTSVNNDTLLHTLENNFSISPPIDSHKAYTTLYLLDKQGRIRGVHDGADAWAVDTLADEIKLLRWEEWDLEKEKKNKAH